MPTSTAPQTCLHTRPVSVHKKDSLTVVAAHAEAQHFTLQSTSQLTKQRSSGLRTLVLRREKVSEEGVAEPSQLTNRCNQSESDRPKLCLKILQQRDMPGNMHGLGVSCRTFIGQKPQRVEIAHNDISDGLLVQDIHGSVRAQRVVVPQQPPRRLVPSTCMPPQSTTEC